VGSWLNLTTSGGGNISDASTAVIRVRLPMASSKPSKELFVLLFRLRPFEVCQQSAFVVSALAQSVSCCCFLVHWWLFSLCTTILL
jgi:hypothetical protein